MPWNAPIVPIGGTVITVAWAGANVVDPITWLRQITGNADPGAANRVLVSVGPTTSAWGQIPDAALAVPKVSKVGDTMTGDLQVNRGGSGAPTTGYLILGNNGGWYFGFDGTQHVLSTPRLSVSGDVYVNRTATPTQGFLILGNNAAHYVGFDGTQIVADGSPIWTDANSPLRVTTPRLADLAVTTAKLADGSVTTAKLADGSVTAAKLAAAVAGYLVPAGIIALWNAPSPPAGWVIDTSYAGRTVIGTGGGFTLVSTGGATTHTHDIAHEHPQGTTEAATGTTMGVQGGSTTAPAPGHTHQFTAPSHGAGGLFSAAASSLPPYLVSNFIRKT